MTYRASKRVTLALMTMLTPGVALAADATAQSISLAQPSPDQWRSSKLLGVAIYGPDNKSVGKITDMLVGKDGTVQDVVIGVGGFLGLGEKDVAIPFAAVSFTKEPITPLAMTAAPVNNLVVTNGANGMGSTAPGAPNGMNGTMAPNGAQPAATAGLGTPVDSLGNPGPASMGAINGDPMMNRSTAYPDHGTIAFNKDQLTSAPAFHFGP